MGKIHPDLQANAIPLTAIRNHLDSICPPDKRKRILQDIYHHCKTQQRADRPQAKRVG